MGKQVTIRFEVSDTDKMVNWLLDEIKEVLTDFSYDTNKVEINIENISK